MRSETPACRSLLIHLYPSTSIYIHLHPHPKSGIVILFLKFPPVLLSFVSCLLGHRFPTPAFSGSSPPPSPALAHGRPWRVPTIAPCFWNFDLRRQQQQQQEELGVFVSDLWNFPNREIGFSNWSSRQMTEHWNRWHLSRILFVFTHKDNFLPGNPFLITTLSLHWVVLGKSLLRF